jgi:hypothetical protein
MKRTVEVIMNEQGIVGQIVVSEPCGFCKSTAGPEHISVCTFCAGELHKVDDEVAQCACCGKIFTALTAL